MYGVRPAALARLILACLVTVLVIASPATAAQRTKSKSAKPAAATTATVPREFFGINGGGLWQQDPARWGATLGSLKAGGLSVVRLDVSWSGIEPKAPAADGTHTFNFAQTDRQVGELAKAGLRAYPLLAYSAPWASTIEGDLMSKPRDNAAFATFAWAVASRYGPNGAFWSEHPELPRYPFEAYEVWNEPNAERFWREQATAPEDYADLYLATRGAIKRVDRAARVVTAGLVDRGAENFLRRMLRHRSELKRNLDAVAYHPYLYQPSDMVRRVQDLRRLLNKAGAKRAPIELTEAGWSTTEIDEAERGRWMADLTRRLTRDPKLLVTRLIPYAAHTSEADAGNWEEWFGLYNADGSPKPSAVAWSKAIKGVNAAAARSARRTQSTGTVTKPLQSARDDLVNVRLR